jgi:hypothetical protein
VRILVVVALAALAAGCAAPVRYDGVYAFGTSYLRLYADGTAIATATEKEAAASELKGWFDRDQKFVSKGSWSIARSRISINLRTPVVPGEVGLEKAFRIDYAGHVDKDGLDLDVHSEIHDRRDHERYRFLGW